MAVCQHNTYINKTKLMRFVSIPGGNSHWIQGVTLKEDMGRVEGELVM